MKNLANTLCRSAALPILGLGLISAASAKPGIKTQQLPDSVPVAVAQSLLVGAPAASEMLHLAIGLEPSSPDGLEGFAAMVSDPKSPNYRHFATPEQIAANFGPAQVDVDNVVSFLKSSGLTITLVSRNHLGILVDGTVAQVQAAFGTQVGNFVGPNPQGKPFAYYANLTPLSVPAGIAGVIQCIEGVDNYARPVHATTLTPQQERVLYNAGPYTNGITGAGCTIGYSNWDGYLVSDARDFISYFGLPIPGGGSGSNIHIVSIGGANNGGAWDYEGNLDMQMELSAAPLANIYVYDGSTSSPSALATYTREVSDNLCDVISESYGWSGFSGVNANGIHTEHVAMTSQGMTYLNASGDSGCSWVVNDSWPDVEPNNVVVGGTMATVNSGGARTSEVTWSGSGGGWTTAGYGSPSNFNVHPSWQTGTGVLTGIPYRMVPDIAAQSQSGSDAAVYMFGGGSLTDVAGTSAASPWCAGGIAIVEQLLVANGQARRLGNPNPTIYGWNGNPVAFFDITSGSSNGTLPNGSASNVTAGWDTVTGWGAPNFDGWYTMMAIQTVPPSSYTLSPGILDAGNLASLAAIDGNYFQASPGPTLNSSQQPIQLVVNATCPVSSVATLQFTVTAHGATNTAQEVDAYNYSTSSWVVLGTQATSSSDSTVTYTITNPSQYIGSGNALQARVQYQATGPTLTFPWNVYIDRAAWIETP